MANIWASCVYFLLISIILIFLFDSSRQPWMTVQSLDYQVYAELSLGSYMVCQPNNSNLTLCSTSNWNSNPWYYLFYFTFTWTTVLYFFLHPNLILENPPVIPFTIKALIVYLVVSIIPLTLFLLIMTNLGSVGWITTAQDWINSNMPKSTFNTTSYYDNLIQFYSMLNSLLMIMSSTASRVALRRQQLAAQAGPPQEGVPRVIHVVPAQEGIPAKGSNTTQELNPTQEGIPA
jgi:hypothetical protein